MTRRKKAADLVRAWHEVTCRCCGQRFNAEHEAAKFCSARCRKRASRSRAENRNVTVAGTVIGAGRPVDAGHVPDRVQSASERKAEAPRGRVYEWSPSLRRMPTNTLLDHEHEYGPFTSRAEWLEWVMDDAAKHGVNPLTRGGE